MTPGKFEELAMRTQANQALICYRIEQLPKMEATTLTQLRNGVTGLSDEVGELNSAVKKYVEYGKPLDITNIQEEVGDCLWRLSQICQAIGYSLEQAMIHNIEKLKVRYPEGFSDFQAAEENRDRAAERQLLEEPLNYGVPSFTYEIKDGKTVYDPQPVQNGQGWEEPQEDFPKAEPEIVASYGDGLVRELLDSSYSRLCNQCHKNKVHHTNSNCICPDCAADLRAGRKVPIIKE